jgi:putative SOS response-associated peptidase YedK
MMPVVIKNNSRKIELMKWGIGEHNLFNARAETILEKYSFRESVRLRRCLVPANAFYEWDKSIHPSKPYRFEVKDNQVFSMAGIFDKGTYSIITTQANKEVEKIHPRMPVILTQEKEFEWLETANTGLLVPYPDGLMLASVFE